MEDRLIWDMDVDVEKAFTKKEALSIMPNGTGSNSAKIKRVVVGSHVGTTNAWTDKAGKKHKGREYQSIWAISSAKSPELYLYKGKRYSDEQGAKNEANILRTLGKYGSWQGTYVWQNLTAHAKKKGYYKRYVDRVKAAQRPKS